MTIIRLFVTLKITDNTALSARHAVRERMGCRALSRLQRSEFWEFQFNALSEAEAIDAVEFLVSKTSHFVNPNKHKWTITPATQPLSEDAAISSPNEGQAAILVCDRIDGKAESTLSAISALLEENKLDLSFDDLPTEEIESVAESLSVTKSRSEGLFSNPHYQTCHVYCY